MNNVFDLRTKVARIEEALTRSDGPPIDRGGGGGDDGGDMEARVEKLEKIAERTGERLTAIERDIAVMRGNYATKEDLHKAINDQTWKLITWTTGLGAALVAITFFLARNVH